MKTLFRPLIVLLCATVAFSSCMKDNSAENEAREREQEEAINASLSADRLKIEEYLMNNPSETDEGWQEDEMEQPLQLIGKSPKRGFWFEVLEVPTEEDDEAYEYELAPGGQGVVNPTVRVNYRVFLLDDDEEAEPVQSGENERFDFATFRSTSNLYTTAWEAAFFPKSYSINGEKIEYGGLTEKGLKKGSHIRVVAPSLWAYGTKEVEGDGGTIPANSPLVYEFEILEIE